MEQKSRELIVAVSMTAFDDSLPFPMHLRILQTVYRRLTHDFTHKCERGPCHAAAAAAAASAASVVCVPAQHEDVR